MTSVCVLGTGLMGAGMARSLARAGLQVTVWNRDGEKARPLAADGITVAEQPADAVRGASVVLTMLFDAESVIAVMNDALGSFADGFIARKIALRYGFFFEPKIVASWVVFPDSVSRKAARDVQRSKYIFDEVPKLIAADSGFPSWYADAFRDRWQFAACRLALQANPIDRPVILELGARSTAEKAKFESILDLLPRRAARLVILAWLWYRLRPTSLTALLRTMLAMRGLRLALGFRVGRIPGMRAATAAPGGA